MDEMKRRSDGLVKKLKKKIAELESRNDSWELEKETIKAEMTEKDETIQELTEELQAVKRVQEQIFALSNKMK